MIVLDDILTGKKISQVLDRTIDSIEAGKREIFEISETIREECQKLNNEIKELKEKIKDKIKEINKIEIEEMKSRNKLAEVSKNFITYSEKDIKNSYEIANNYRIKLMITRKEEKDLIHQRNSLEMKLKTNYNNLKRAEKVTAQIGVALKYLNENANKVSKTVDNLNKKQLLGIKIIKAQEEERQRVARDVHDGPAQMLANLILKTEITEKMINIDNEKAVEELRDLKSIVRTSLKDVRKIIYDLRPMSLDDLGLIPTIKRYSEFFYEETQIEVNIKVLAMEEELDVYRNLTIFRIVQEALNNVKKHSEATQVLILIESNTKSFNLVIKDNGKGFDLDKVDTTSNDINCGYGIMGIKERAILLDAILDIKSEEDKGTKITLTIPMNREGESYE